MGTCISFLGREGSASCPRVKQTQLSIRSFRKGRTAEFVAKYVDKGARIGVSGQLQVDTWKDKETGEPRNSAKIVVRDLDVLETRAEAELRRGNAQQRRTPYNNKNRDSDNDGGNPVKAGSGGFFD